MEAPAGAPSERFYAAVRLIARFWVWFFFKGVDARRPEIVPARGPVLLCINHPNNLIDSLLVGVVLARKVHYLATAALFRNALVRRFLLACGAIPVYRRQDDPDKMDRNADAFRECFGVLARGHVVGIYPEGTTHAESRVQHIKTGAARIALQYEAQRRAGEDGAPLVLIPVGLTFDARKAFRGRVRVAFGEPIALDAYAEPYRGQPAETVGALTAEIEWGMQALIVRAPGSRAELVRAVEDLYRADLVRELEEARGLSPREIDPLRLSQGIADAVAYFEARDPERLERLWRAVQDYRALLAQYHVRDRAVRARGLAAPRRRRLWRSGEASLGLPLFFYGALVNALPYAVPRWIARRTSRKETDYATTRLLASVVAFPLFWGLETWAVWRLAGALWAALFALSLPASGMIAYHYLGGAARVGGQLRFALLALGRRQAAGRLLGARRDVIALLEEARGEYLAATRGSSF